MSIEKNIIFIYPILPVLNDLKLKLEEDDSYNVYEMDSTNEYKQLVGVLETSITFSSDMKKTSYFLQENTNFLTGPNTKSFAVTNKTIPPFVIGKLQKFGLTELLKDDVQLKSLLHKVESFYLQLESKEKAEKDSKEKSLAGVLIMNKNTNKEVSTDEKQRVEKLIVDKKENEKIDPKLKKIDLSGIQIGGGQLRSKLGYSSGSFSSPFDNIQRKKVVEFKENNTQLDLKKSTFSLPDNEYAKKRNNFKDQTEDPKLKKLTQFKSKEMLPSKKKNPVFKEVDREQKKHEKFEEQTIIGKKNNKFVEVDIDKKKSKGFEEIPQDLNRKKYDFKEVDGPLRKKKKIDLSSLDLNKKSLKFEEVELSKKKRKTIDLDFQDIKKKDGVSKEEDEELNRKKKNIHFDESEMNKKNKKFEQVDIDLQKKNKSLDLVEIEKDKSKTTLNLDLDQVGNSKKLNLDEETKNKKNTKLDQIDPNQNKKSSTFNKVEIERKKKGQFIDVEIERESNWNKNKDKKLDQHKNKSLNLDLENKKNKNLNNIVIGEKKEKNLQSLEAETKEKNSQIENLLKMTRKDWGEQTIDYKKMKIEMAEKKAMLRSEEQVKLDKSIADQLALLEEVTYFYPGTFGLEYLVHEDALLFTESIDNIKALKFIHFSLIKEMNADISFYLFNDFEADPEGIFSIGLIYHGHKVNTTESQIYSLEEEISNELSQKWAKYELPTWDDETFRAEINHFVYPFFDEGKKYGFAIASFKDSIKGHYSAIKAELLIMSAKSIILSESKL